MANELSKAIGEMALKQVTFTFKGGSQRITKGEEQTKNTL